jgi:hypothetical protein
MTATNNGNYPMPATCFRCGNKQAELLPPLGDRDDYRCPTCGEFSVSGTDERLFELGTADRRTAPIVTDETGRRWLRAPD